jgi:hypothetical protein
MAAWQKLPNKSPIHINFGSCKQLNSVCKVRIKFCFEPRLGGFLQKLRKFYT